MGGGVGGQSGNSEIQKTDEVKQPGKGGCNLETQKERQIQTG